MHQTNRVSCLPCWCWLTALGLLSLFSTGRAEAQQKLPTAHIIPINETKEIPSRSGEVVVNAVADKANIKLALTADKKRVVITALAPGRTNVTITDIKGGIEVVQVFVPANVELLRQVLRQAVPTSNVTPIPSAQGTVILTGTVGKSEDVQTVLDIVKGMGMGYINGLRVGGVMQVQLDVLIAQVSRNELRNMSFSWFNSGSEHFIASALSPTNNAASSAMVDVASVAGALAGSSNLLLGLVNDDSSFFGFLDALRSEGLAKFLACPKLVTMSGQPADFLSGGRLAVPEPSGLGTNAVRFEPFGTQLSFVPIVLGNGKVQIHVVQSVNNVNNALGTTISGTTVPGFDTQRLNAFVELEPGQTFAIGGLIQNQVNATTSKVPVLGDLPFIGAAFSTKSFNHTETELLVLVTPHLVDAMACDQLPKLVPGQETRIPDDFELFIEGILEAPRGQREIFPGGRYKAAYLNGPTSNTWPCGVGGYGGGACGHGGCGLGGCGTGGCANPGPSGPATKTGQATLSFPSTQQPPLAPLPSQPLTLPAGYEGQQPIGSTLPSSPSASLPSGEADVVLPTTTGPGVDGGYYESTNETSPAIPVIPAPTGSSVGGVGQ